MTLRIGGGARTRPGCRQDYTMKVNDGRCRLVLLRHGQSEWNARNLFTGWANPDLTAAGEREAVRAGQLLATHGLAPGLAHPRCSGGPSAAPSSP
jgi:Histidine phosphatase superfamily (branch 1)